MEQPENEKQYILVLANAKCEECGNIYHSCKNFKDRWCDKCRGKQYLSRERLKSWRAKNRFHDTERDKQKRIQNNLDPKVIDN